MLVLDLKLLRRHFLLILGKSRQNFSLCSFLKLFPFPLVVCLRYKWVTVQLCRACGSLAGPGVFFSVPLVRGRHR